jgi:hypothetical protein
MIFQGAPAAMSLRIDDYAAIPADGGRMRRCKQSTPALP